MKIGIIGAGKISKSFAKSVTASGEFVISAVGSRTIEKATEFAQETGAGTAYGSYEQMIEQADIDAVYVGTPNSLHYENTVMAAKAGKHIICEKPIATTVSQVKEMFDCAEHHKVQLIEAFPFRFQPQTIGVLSQLNEGILGKAQTMFAGFGFHMTRTTDVRLEPELEGGSLWDVGVYAINLSRAVMGSCPVSVLASGVIGSEGVDRDVSAVLTYADGRSATIWSSFNAVTRSATIIGEKGSLTYQYENHLSSEESAKVKINRLGEVSEQIAEQHNGFLAEAQGLRALVTGDTPFYGTTKQESIENTATGVAILKSLKSERRVEVTF